MSRTSPCQSLPYPTKLRTKSATYVLADWTITRRDSAGRQILKDSLLLLALKFVRSIARQHSYDRSRCSYCATESLPSPRGHLSAWTSYRRGGRSKDTSNFDADSGQQGDPSCFFLLSRRARSAKYTCLRCERTTMSRKDGPWEYSGVGRYVMTGPK
ncbi:hypothetical protein K523DRAFT_136061 [Schizophyllum commune Tattone D]|nr:hypothetical protein K523DRAFT_136061 [Schizophyllum commune Tattone D]